MRLRKDPIFALTLIIGMFRAAAGVEAQEDITVTSSVDKAKITIGDLITYTVTVTHHPKLRVEMPGLGANLGGFEIRDYEVHDPRKEEGRIVSSVDYVISTFLTGEFEIPPLSIQYFTPDDSTGRMLTTEKIEIVVESVKPSEAGDIRDIKPPMEIPRKLWVLLRWFVLGGGIAVLAAAAVVLYRRKKAGKSLLPQRQEPPRPPHEVAFERLEALKHSGLLERNEIKAFYIEVSEIIRQYVEGRYYIVAMEMTTEEVLGHLADADVSEEEYKLCEDFLDRCDLVKFAKVIPSSEENDAIVQTAYEIVERTKVVLEEPAEKDEEQDGPAPDGAASSEEAREKTTDAEVVGAEPVPGSLPGSGKGEGDV